MKIISTVLVLSLFIAIPSRSYAVAPVSVSAESCVLMYEDGRSVYEKNADDKRLIASTTKIMTAIICIEELGLNERVKIKAEHCNVEGSSMYLKAGEYYTVKELLLGLLLASGNDAALALSDYVAGDNNKFASLMNKKAAFLGMDNSSFVNPHGLDARNHYSTAKDMATLMLYCMQNETFSELCSTESTVIKNHNYRNHNKLLGMCGGCIAGKTGFTAAAGRCLVSCVERNGIRLVCVTLSAPDDWNDHCKLYDYAYENYVLRDITNEAEYLVPVISGSREVVKIRPEKKLFFFVNKKDKIKLNAEIPNFIFAPVKMGETAGNICVIINNNVVSTHPLVYAEGVVIGYPCQNEAGVEVSI